MVKAPYHPQVPVFTQKGTRTLFAVFGIFPTLEQRLEARSRTGTRIEALKALLVKILKITYIYQT